MKTGRQPSYEFQRELQRRGHQKTARTLVEKDSPDGPKSHRILDGHGSSSSMLVSKGNRRKLIIIIIININIIIIMLKFNDEIYASRSLQVPLTIVLRTRKTRALSGCSTVIPFQGLLISEVPLVPI